MTYSSRSASGAWLVKYTGMVRTIGGFSGVEINRSPIGPVRRRKRPCAKPDRRPEGLHQTPIVADLAVVSNFPML